MLMIHDPFHPFILYTEKQTVGIACKAHETVFFTVIVSSKAFPLPVRAGRGMLRNVNQPFRPLVAIPCTKKRWQKMYTMKTGIRLTTEAAIIS